jgi:hypothetical protein
MRGRHPSAEWIALQLTQAYGWQQAPRYIIRDRDRAYGHAFLRRLRAMGIRDRPIDHDRLGRTDARSGSSDRSDGIALTMSSCLASAISGICSIRTRNITTRRAHTYHYGRMRRSLAPCRPSVRRSPCLFWVGCIIDISERKFPTRTVRSPCSGRTNAGRRQNMSPC